MNQQTVNTVIHILLIVAIAVALMGNTSCSEQGREVSAAALTVLQAKTARDRAQTSLPIVVANLKSVNWTEDERTKLKRARAAIKRFADSGASQQFLDKTKYLAARHGYLQAYDVIFPRLQELDVEIYLLALELDADVRTIGRFLDQINLPANPDNPTLLQEHGALIRDVGAIAVGLAEVGL